MERQKHGFIYENKIITENNLEKSPSYTNKWDAFEVYNGYRLPVSVKCIKNGSSIEFGDFKRQTEITTDFILYVGFWSENDNNIIEQYKIFIKKETWFSYFGDLSIIDEMLSCMKDISNDIIDDGRWYNFRQKFSGLYGVNNVISLRFKRDHKKQKRIQCGITKKNFLNKVVKENKIL